MGEARKRDRAPEPSRGPHITMGEARKRDRAPEPSRGPQK